MKVHLDSILGHLDAPRVPHLGYPAGTRDPEQNLLAGLARLIPGNILEQGCRAGGATRILSGFAQGTIYSVDIEEHDLGCGIWEHKNVERTIADATTFLPPEPCEFCFSDAAHGYDDTVSELERAIEAGCRVILVHDTGENHGCGCRPAALDTFGEGWTVFDIGSPQGMILAIEDGHDLLERLPDA